MQLGQLLVHRGVITTSQLEEALRRQVVYGGRLGTNLIELGYADVDAVSHGLARLHRVPAALTRHLDRHDPDALAMVPRELAVESVVIPVAFALSGEGRQLVACMRDPGDRETIARLRRTAGLEVVVCVAAELILYFWLERCYGIAPVRRQAHVQPGTALPLPRPTAELPVTPDPDDSVDIDMDEADDVVADMDEADDVVADMDEADDVVAEEIAMPAELSLVELDDGAVVRDQSQYAFGVERGLTSLLERAGQSGGSKRTPPSPSPAGDLADAARGAESVKNEAASLARGIAAAAARHVSPPDAEPRVISAEQALAAIAEARDRDGVADAVIAFMRGVFAGGLMLLAKEGLALGHRGFGGSFDAITVESVVFPLTVPSVFLSAYESNTVYRGPPHAEGGVLEERFFKLFRLEAPPAELVVVPVAIKSRVVCLLYAHGRDGSELDDGAVRELKQAARATSEAFVRLIKQTKRRKAN